MINSIQSDLYDQTVNDLKKFVVKTNLLYDKNPVIKNLNNLKSKDLKNCILEHSSFCHEAIHLLLEAKIRTYAWPLLVEEIDNNIKEEMGLKTGNIPHLEMMRYGYKKDLRIETRNHKPSKHTQNFVKNLWKIFKTSNNAYLAGALLAFEGMAINEFSILDQIVNKYSKKIKSCYTCSYVEGHKEFEVDHELRLRNAIRPYINESNIKDFIKGYKEVILLMNKWWSSL